MDRLGQSLLSTAAGKEKKSVEGLLRLDMCLLGLIALARGKQSLHLLC